MSEPTEAMVEAAAKFLCCGPACNASGRPGDRCTANEIFYEKARSALTAALAIQPEAEQGWRPIETAKEAKKYGRRVLLYNQLWEDTFGDRQVGYWQEDKWLFDSEMNINDVEDEELDAADGKEPMTITKADWQPTHWRPLPAPPPAEGQKP